MNLSKKQREQVRAMFDGRCAYCGLDLTGRKWHADHVEPIGRHWWKKTPLVQHKWDEAAGRMVKTVTKQEMGCDHPERDCIENMMPACHACNIDKSATPLELWRKCLEDKVGVLRRNYSAFRHAERFGLLTVSEKPIVFYFEQFTSPGQVA